MAIKNINTDFYINSSNNVGLTLEHASRPTISLTDGTNTGFIGLDNGGAIITGTSDNDLAIRSPRNIVFGGNSIARMSITNAGYVGIGTTDPQKELDVQGTVRANSSNGQYQLRPTQLITYGVDAILNAQSGGDDVRLNTQSSTVLIATAEGNVGIGTTNPAYKLTVNGDVDINNGALLVQQAYGINLGASGYNIWMPTTTRVGIQTAATERLSILNNGNVGIGITSPSTKLHVDGSVTSEDLLIAKNGFKMDNVMTHSTNALAGHNSSNVSRNRYNFMDIAVNSYHWVGSSPIIIEVFQRDFQGAEYAKYILQNGYIDNGGSQGGSGENVNDFRLILKESNSWDGNSNNHRILIGDPYDTGNDQSDYDVYAIPIYLDAWYYSDYTVKVTFQSTSITRVSSFTSATQYIFRESPTATVISGVPTELPSGPNSVYGTLYGGGAVQISSSEDRISNITAYYLRPDGASNLQGNLTVGGNVGIGTTSPDEKLDVVGTGTQLGSTGYYYNTRIKDSTNSGVLLGGNATENGVGFIAGINQLAFLTYDSGWGERMRINGGNVGIGTSSPAQPLHVLNNSSANVSAKIRVQGGSTSGHADLAVQSSHVRLYVNDVQTIAYSAGVQYNYINGNVAKTLTATGLGIGTTAPEDKLDIVGNLRICSSKTANTNKTNRIRGEHYNIAEEPHTFMFMNSFSTSNQLHIGGGSSIENAATSLRFFTAANNTTVAGTERMRINSSGNVGIGTTSPDGQLHVKGSTNRTLKIDSTLVNGTGSFTTVSFARNGDDKWRIWQWGDDRALSFYNEATSSHQLTLKSDGNVGIGTTSPQQKLHVEGNIYLGPNNTNNFIHSGATLGLQSDSHIFIVSDVNDTSGVGGTDIIFGYGSSTNTDSNQDFTESELGTYPRVEVMRIDSSTDRVGIGTASPASKLHVDDNAATGAGLLVTGGGSGASLATFRRDVGNTGSEVSISAASGDAQMLFTNSTHFYSIGIDASENKFKISDNNYIGTNDRFTIDGSGNVGIGTTSPSAALDVVGSSKFRGTVNHSWFNYSTGEDTYIRGGKTTSKVHINDSHSADVLIAVGGGNVGIGTTSPSEKLDVNGIASTSSYFKYKGHPLNMSYGQGGSDSVLFDYTHYSDKAFLSIAADTESNTTSSSSEWVASSDHPFAGGKVLQTSGYRSFYSDYIPVTPGEELYGEIYTKYISGSGGVLYYGIERFDSEKNAIGGNTGTTYFVVGNVNHTSTSWTKNSGYTTLPTTHTAYNGSNGGGCYYVRIRILFNYSSGGAVRQFGGIMLKRTGVAHDQLISGNVGIGTASPNVSIQAESNSSQDKRTLRLAYDSSYYFDIANLGSGGVHYNAVNAGSGGHKFQIDGSEKVRISYAGNVGIGTTSPSNKLTVEDTIGIKRSGVAAITTLQQTGIGLELNAPAGYHPFVIKYNNTEYARFTNTGNVGIGTTSPNSPLSVQSNSGGGAARFIGRSSDSISGLEFFNNAESSSVYLQGNGSWFRSRADGGFHFARGVTPTTSDTDGFTINGLNVGIGVTNPQAYLDIRGGGAIFSTTLTNNDDWSNSPISILERDVVGTGQSADKYSPNLNFHWTGRISNSLWMASNGYLNWGGFSSSGIPSADGVFQAATGRFNQLHIQGGYALGSSANFLYIDPNTQFSSGIYINNAVKVDGGLLGSYNEDLQLRTGANTRLTLSSSTGNATFAADVDVNGITTSDAFRTDTSNTDYNVISRNSTSGTLYVQAAQSNSIQTIASFRYGSATVAQGTEVLAVRRNSSYFINTKLGIGTNNPGKTLDVSGEVRVSNGDLEVVGSSEGIILTAPSGGRYRISVNDSGELQTSAV